MSLKAVVFFALLAVAVAGKLPAVAERPRVGLQMPPISLPSALPPSPQVVGGEEAPVGSYPFIASLTMLSQHFCAGSIISETKILTAAHCIKAIPLLFLVTVNVGKHDISRTEDTQQSASVSRAVIHPNYAGGVGPFDIGILKLSSSLRWTNAVQPIQLAPSGSKWTSGDAWLSGWGSVSNTNNPIMPNKLQQVKMQYIDLATCSQAVKNLTGNPSPVADTNICTGPLNNGISACSGDSGGPLITRNEKGDILTGVVSWGIMPCGTQGAPSVFTEVSSYNDWIKQN